MPVETRHVRYIFADVVRFTENRTLEAQVEIIAALNQAFVEAIGGLETVYLPTGDGICAGILSAEVPADIHLQTALRILEIFYRWSGDAPHNRRAEIRIAINESVDALITDINGNRNLAGVGINSAQRLMNIADGNQIIVGNATFETLVIRDKYVSAFRPIKAEIKHEHILNAYQFIAVEAPYLNIEIPWTVLRTDPIDIEMNEEMSRPGGYSTQGMIRATHSANERWQGEMGGVLARLSNSCTKEQNIALTSAQNAWQLFYDAEVEFLIQLRKTVRGTMYSVLGVATAKTIMRERVLSLRNYLNEWIGPPVEKS